MSPDDSDVVFLSDNGGHANVWTARVADGEMRPVTRQFDPRVVVAVPVWSPQGDWINFLQHPEFPDAQRDAAVSEARWQRLARPGDRRRLGVLVGRRAVAIIVRLWRMTFITSRKCGLTVASPCALRDDDAIGCQSAPDGSALSYPKDSDPSDRRVEELEVRRARPENGPSEVIGRVAGTRVPTMASNFQPFLSPDGNWLAMPLLDGSTTNLWALSTARGEWRKLIDFGERNVMITRRVAWSKDGRHMYAAVSDVDSDIVILVGLR